MAILSIQSHVAYGHVGNDAAVFPLQRQGFEVWPVMTVQFSNHTGYAGTSGTVFPATQVADVISGIADRGVFGECEAVLSGYLGSAPLGEVVVDAVAQVRTANPAALYCCDPVMGDLGRGLYVDEDVPAFMRAKALPAADVITPNQFELEQLTGQPVETLEDVVAGARAAMAMGPRIVLVTSLRHADTAYDEIEMLAVDADRALLVATPRLPFEIPPNGAGDAMAALFLAQLLRRRDLENALANAAASIYGIISATFDAGTRELAIIAAQDKIVAPSVSFSVKKLA